MNNIVFISYSSDDKSIADDICEKLEEKDIKSWIAPRDIPPGKLWGEAIIEAIESCALFILIFSKNANSSDQVLREVERAVNNSKEIIPFKVANFTPSKSFEYYLSISHWLDASTPPIDKHIEKLQKTVDLLLSKTVQENKDPGLKDIQSTQSLSELHKNASNINHAIQSKHARYPILGRVVRIIILVFLSNTAILGFFKYMFPYTDLSEVLSITLLISVTFSIVLDMFWTRSQTKEKRK